VYIKTTTSICGHRIGSNKVDKVSQFIVNNILYNVYVGACQSDLIPHYHILNQNAELLIGIECMDNPEFIQVHNCIDAPLIKAFLPQWLHEENCQMSLLSNISFIELLWYANHPFDKCDTPVQNPAPVPIILFKDKEITISVLEEEDRITKFVFYIKPYDLKKFLNQHPVNGIMDGYKILEVTVV
jgi:hypothetical protein